MFEGYMKLTPWAAISLKIFNRISTHTHYTHRDLPTNARPPSTESIREVYFIRKPPLRAFLYFKQEYFS